MVPADAAAGLAIEVVYSPAAGAVRQVSLQMPPVSNVREALRLSGLLEACPELSLDSLTVGVWGKLRSLDDGLRDKDRVEVYRPLLVDPKEARRQRFQSQKPSRGSKAGR